VNFRVNEEEYAALRTACSENGARSISDFARLAVLRHAAAEERRAASMQWQIAALGHKMSELEFRVSQLLRMLESAEEDGESGMPPGARAAMPSRRRDGT